VLPCEKPDIFTGGSHTRKATVPTCISRQRPRTTPLEAVMDSIRNSLGMRETEIAREPNRLWNPYFYAISAEVHNTL